MARKMHRVVVTGLGVVSCYGLGAQSAWENVLAARSGITAMNEPMYAKQPCLVYGKVPLAGQTNLPAAVVPFNPDKYASKAQQREMGPVGLFAMAAVDEALSDAQWHPKTDEQRHKSGVIMGTAFSDYQFISDCSIECQKQESYGRLTPFFGPRLILNMPAARASIRFGLQAVQLSPTTACATGTHAVGDAFRLLRNGACDVVVCGGADASLSAMTFAGLSKMRALSTGYNQQPQQASRPFDAARDGFVMSEGGAALVLERLEHFLRRTASCSGQQPRVYAEVLGYGFSADGHHVSAPRPDGSGMRRSMQAALRDARLSAAQVTHFNCHATATAIGDVAEVRAVSDLLQSAGRGHEVFLNSTKGATGHMVAAAGAVESVFTALACKHGVIAPCTNLTAVDPAIKQLVDCTREKVGVNLSLVGLGDGKPAAWQVPKGERRIALKNSFGFGGTNASICLASYS